MYADDTTLSTTLNSSAQCPETINIALTNISNWLKLNKLSLNAKKTKMMIFHNKNKKYVTPYLNIDNVPIQQVDTFNFLGLTLDDNLTWKKHISKISSKIARAES